MNMVEIVAQSANDGGGNGGIGVLIAIAILIAIWCKK